MFRVYVADPAQCAAKRTERFDHDKVGAVSTRFCVGFGPPPDVACNQCGRTLYPQSYRATGRER